MCTINLFIYPKVIDTTKWCIFNCQIMLRVLLASSCLYVVRWCITQRRVSIYIDRYPNELYVWHVFYVSERLCEFYYVVPVPNSLNSHISSVLIFNGLNFSDWNEQVQFHLNVLDLDLAILEEKHATITDINNNEEKAHYKIWKRSNKINLMFMRMTVSDSIKITLSKTDSVKEFIKLVLVGECSQTADKSLAGTLMSTPTTMKFDGSRTMHKHVIEMTNIVARLKTLGMVVNKNFLVRFILNSLPFEYGSFQMSYNIMKDK